MLNVTQSFIDTEVDSIEQLEINFVGIASPQIAIRSLIISIGIMVTFDIKIDF